MFALKKKSIKYKTYFSRNTEKIFFFIHTKCKLIEKKNDLNYCCFFYNYFL